MFEKMVEQFQAMMYYTAMQVVKDKQKAEDIVQEAWIKVFRQGPQLTQVEKLGSWLKTITKRTAIDQLRKDKRHQMYLFEEPGWMEEMTLLARNFVEESLNSSLMLEEMEQCLGNRPKLLAVFHLKISLELDDQQIADRLHISQGAVKTRVFRVRQLLKDYYIEKDELTLSTSA
ncbi:MULTISPECIES: RNA polymerase sigma factor [Gracilibacillus]|uniref:RNA polymerase sigma factor n=1 Tax=Gracilibacillus TaxID=74385 RepID=UPI000826C489|nr:MULTISPECIES: RNA polymerase sigma factor [Gracilibacillus]